MRILEVEIREGEQGAVDVGPDGGFASPSPRSEEDPLAIRHRGRVEQDKGV